MPRAWALSLPAAQLWHPLAAGKGARDPPEPAERHRPARAGEEPGRASGPRTRPPTLTDGQEQNTGDKAAGAHAEVINTDAHLGRPQREQGGGYNGNHWAGRAGEASLVFPGTCTEVPGLLLIQSSALDLVHIYTILDFKK